MIFPIYLDNLDCICDSFL